MTPEQVQRYFDIAGEIAALATRYAAGQISPEYYLARRAALEDEANALSNPVRADGVAVTVEKRAAQINDELNLLDYQLRLGIISAETHQARRQSLLLELAAQISPAGTETRLEEIAQTLDVIEPIDPDQPPPYPEAFTPNEAVAITAAHRIWRERDGVILCECDDPDCCLPIAISRAEYLHASGPFGANRLTAPACPHGVLGYWLTRRAPGWLIWTSNE